MEDEEIVQQPTPMPPKADWEEDYDWYMLMNDALGG